MSNIHVYCFWSCNVQGDYNKNREISEKGGSADGKLLKTSTKTEKTETLHLVTSRIKER